MIYNWTVTCGEYCKHGKDNKIIMYLGRWRKLGLWGDTLTLYFDNKDDNKVNEEDKYFYINKLKNDKLDNDIYENLIQVSKSYPGLFETNWQDYYRGQQKILSGGKQKKIKTKKKSIKKIRKKNRKIEK